MRSPAAPYKILGGARHHETPILHMDFSTVKEGDLVSSDDQQKILFWDTVKDNAPRHKILTPETSVWKMR